MSTKKRTKKTTTNAANQRKLGAKNKKKASPPLKMPTSGMLDGQHRQPGWVELALGPDGKRRFEFETQERGPKGEWTAVDVAIDAVIADPLEHFRQEWARLPPMIRAGEATAIALHLAQQASNEEARVNWVRTARLPRREKVIAAFSAASAMIQHLFLSLARTADEDAEKLGIDVDVDSPTTKVVSQTWTKGDQKIVVTTRAPANEKK